MLNFYLLSLIPAIIGAILWVTNKKIVLWEYLTGTIIAFILSGIFHFISIKGMTGDEEIWSGQIMSERFIPTWKEYYEYAVYRTETSTSTDSKGNRTTTSYRVFDHWEPTTRLHNESWTAYSNINTSYSINAAHYVKLEKEFKHSYKVAGNRTTGEHNSRMIDGDKYDYISENRTGYIEPIVEIKNFENRIKAAPSVFSFTKVPPNIRVFDWPRPTNPWHTNRVLGGIAKKVIPTRKWDELNAVLGPKYKINLILAGFEANDPSLLQYQEAKFVGGKKNDLVISFCGPANKPQNVKVFGWTESDICKKNIESFIIENGVNEKLLTYLPEEIQNNYKIKDWNKFDYLNVEPDVEYYYWFFGILIFTQLGLYCFFHFNELNKMTTGYENFKSIFNM